MIACTDETDEDEVEAATTNALRLEPRSNGRGGGSGTAPCGTRSGGKGASPSGVSSAGDASLGVSAAGGGATAATRTGSGSGAGGGAGRLTACIGAGGSG